MSIWSRSKRQYNEGFEEEPQKSSRLPTNRALNCEQEQAIKDYIERLNEQNFLTKVSMIRAAANYILAKLHSDPLLITPPQVSENGDQTIP